MGVSTLLMKALRVFVYVSIGVDLTDCVFDFRMVHQLAQHDATRKQAAWLGVCTTIALALELVKHKLRQRMENDTVVAKYDRERTVRNRTQLTEEQKRITDFYPTAYDAENTQVSFDMHEDRHRANYIICIGCLELTIFYVEDATTLFVWWQTGVYNNADRLAQANLASQWRPQSSAQRLPCWRLCMGYSRYTTSPVGRVFPALSFFLSRSLLAPAASSSGRGLPSLSSEKAMNTTALVSVRSAPNRSTTQQTIHSFSCMGKPKPRSKTVRSSSTTATSATATAARGVRG